MLENLRIFITILSLDHLFYLKCNINTGHKNGGNIIDVEGKIKLPGRTADCR